MRLMVIVLALLATAGDAYCQARSSPRYDVDRTPFLEIGGDGTGSDPFLEGVFSATRVGQGFVVADSRSSSLLFFDDKGELVRTVGRQGQGPGEFTGGVFVSPCARNSLIAWDSRLGRVSIFTESGEFVRQFYAPATSVTCAGDDVVAMLLRPSASATDRASTAALKSSIMLVDLDGDSIGAIAQVPWGENRLFGLVDSRLQWRAAPIALEVRPTPVYTGYGLGVFFDIGGGDFGGLILEQDPAVRVLSGELHFPNGLVGTWEAARQ